MFIKVTTSGKYQYAQIVKAYRDEEGKSRHTTLFNLGRLDHIENNPSFQNIAKKLLALSNAQGVIQCEDISEAEIVNWGYVIYKKIWEAFDLHVLLPQLTANTKVSFELNNSAFLMAIQHLLRPSSKLKTFQKQNQYLNIKEVTLNQLYRSLDLLCENKAFLEEKLYKKNRSLFNMKIDVIFYDVTTFSFESVKADTLRDFGYSKDGKFKEVQVVLGLLIDCEGRPIGYDLFPGNTFEGHTLEKTLEKIEERFGIRNVIIVADRGLNSKLNIKRIKDKGYSYIVASRIKKMKKSIQEEIFNDDGYIELYHVGYENKEDRFVYKTFEHVNSVRDEEGKIFKIEENLIITYSPQRAQKDRKDRERLIEKAQCLLENKGNIKASNKRGGKKYLKEIQKENSDWVLDDEAIAKDEMFDGYYGIQTDRKDMKPEEIIEAYHNLWRIEESFRIMKSTLEVRPVFHWTESRIKGHFVICFLAFLLERTLEFKLTEKGEQATPEKIREAINSMTFSEFDVDGETYYLKNKGTDLSKTLLRLFRIRPPHNIVKKEELTIF